MVAGNFKASLAFVLQSEGGNDDDPEDHGGRTSRGITQREYTAWRAEQKLLEKDVWTASDDDIRAIYYEEYWLPYCDDFPPGIDYLFFDMAVNSGPYRAAVLLQRALGVADDGRIGPISKQALKKADLEKLIKDFSNEKRKFYTSLGQKRFLKGWLNRTKSAEKSADSMLAIAQLNYG